MLRGGLWLALASLALTVAAHAAPAAAPALPPRENDAMLTHFHFASGESLAALRVHYLTLGTLKRDAQGHATNAVLVLHGTGGTGRQFLVPQFAKELYGAGQPLDTTRYFIVLPDGIGHGRSSKPSDGMHVGFPRYDYDDMVAAHHRLLTETLGVDHLRLVMGTSMGAMHTFVWGETYPDFMDALMPLACNAVAIVGRNRLWREMAVDAIRSDPAWKDGEYTSEPMAGLRAAEDLIIVAGSAPIYMQATLSTRDSVDRWLAGRMQRDLPALDANDMIGQLEASRHYDPSGKLAAIRAPLTWVNSSDDFINPPELGLAEKQVKEIHGGRFVLIPASEKTHGHGTHTWAALWKDELVALLARSEPKR
jgi:homoserine O-acetyltransferase